MVAALAVPQALGYAAIAGVPVEMGLYAVPVALVAYVIFGTFRPHHRCQIDGVGHVGALVAAFHPADTAQAVLFTAAAPLGRHHLADRGPAEGRLGRSVLVQADRHRVRDGTDAAGHHR